MIVPERSIRTVLVADDDALIRQIVGMMLASEGWVVREAASGDAVVEALETGEIDLCIMDRWMPGPPLESRLATMRRLHPGAGVVVLSGDPGAEHPPDIVQLNKPVDIADLRDGIARAVALHSREGGATLR